MPKPQSLSCRGPARLFTPGEVSRAPAPRRAGSLQTGRAAWLALSTLSTLGTLSTLAAPAHAEDLSAQSQLADASLSLRQPEPPAASPSASTAADTLPPTAELSLRPAFGEKGSTHWGFYGGAAPDIEDDQDAVDVYIAAAWQHFFVDRVEVILELAAFYHDQEGDDAYSINPNLVLRWHFLEREKWTVFADAGIGILASSDDVPEGGTSFNLTPRAGVGATYALTESLRLVGGVRWHHISNARIEGEEANPDRDGVMIYGGVLVPF